jgi:hypothetical protein
VKFLEIFEELIGLTNGVGLSNVGLIDADTEMGDLGIGDTVVDEVVALEFCKIGDVLFFELLYVVEYANVGVLGEIEPRKCLI